jgi:anti-sigma-K factor RskA
MRGETGDLELIAVVDPAAGDIALRRLAGGAPADRVLELWAILPEQAPISLGVLPETEVARVNLPADLADRTPLMTLAITDEPPGGAPEGSPTGEIRAVGAVNEL